MAEDHLEGNQSAQRNMAAWDGYESCHHVQKKQDSETRRNDQVWDQKCETLARQARREKKMNNQHL